MNELKDSQGELEQYGRRLYIAEDCSSKILVKRTLIKHLGWNVWALLFGLRPFSIELFYHDRKNLKRNVKVKLDLTKKRYLIFAEAVQ